MQLIAFLGRGNYQPTRYVLEGREEAFETRYCTVALAKLLGCRSLTVLTTEEAAQQHWEELSKALAGLGCELRRRDIAVPASRDQVAQLLQVLIDEGERCSPEEPLAIDITHSFRAIPFFAGVLVSYLHASRPQRKTPIRLFYGAFEASSGGFSPIWELSEFSAAIELIAAVHLFERTGHAEELAERVESFGRAIRKEWAQSRPTPEPPSLAKFGSALREFALALDAIRVHELFLPHGTKPSAVDELLSQIKAVLQELYLYSPLLQQPLARLTATLQSLSFAGKDFSEPTTLAVFLSLAEQYLRWGRLAEAAVTIREGVVNLFAPPAAAKPGAGFDESARSQAEERCRVVLRDLWRDIARVRNDIEHGGFNRQPVSGASLRKQLEKLIERLRQLEEKPPREETPGEGRTWFVSRHEGARDWLRRQGIPVTDFVAHLEPERVSAGDTVIGTFPAHIAAELCERGARVVHLALDVPPEARGRELSADDLDRFGARLVEMAVRQVGDYRPHNIANPAGGRAGHP